IKMLHSCQASFAASGVPLHVRCGLAVGPAFACVIGSVRVSYDIFGLAPARARLMEELSPVGNVTVSRDVYELLSHGPGLYMAECLRKSGTGRRGSYTRDRALPRTFIFGDVVTKNPQSTSAVQALLETAKDLLETNYFPSSSDDSDHAIERAETALQAMVERCCGPEAPVGEETCDYFERCKAKGETLPFMQAPHGVALSVT
ncbi:hypothetical protein KIPB_015133, partial [Kipferlia bialata]